MAVLEIYSRADIEALHDKIVYIQYNCGKELNNITIDGVYRLRVYKGWAKLYVGNFSGNEFFFKFDFRKPEIRKKIAWLEQTNKPIAKSFEPKESKAITNA